MAALTKSKLSGIDLRIGKEPPSFTPSMVLDINEIYLMLFDAFGKNPKKRVVMAFQDSTDEDAGLQKFGTLTLSKARKRLAYEQLITLRQFKEPTGEVVGSNPTGKPKMRTLTILEPTSRGYEVLEEGLLLNVPLWFQEHRADVGIGKPYPTFKQLWNRLETMFTIYKISKSRRENWFYEFKRYFQDTLCVLPVDQATEATIEFGRQHVATAPKKKFRIQDTATEIDFHKNQRQLSLWQA